MADEDDEENFDSVRDIPELRKLIGCTLDDISCSDKDDGKPDKIFLLFNNGTVVTVTLGADEEHTFSFETMD